MTEDAENIAESKEKTKNAKIKPWKSQWSAFFKGNHGRINNQAVMHFCPGIGFAAYREEESVCVCARARVYLMCLSLLHHGVSCA